MTQYVNPLIQRDQEYCIMYHWAWEQQKHRELSLEDSWFRTVKRVCEGTMMDYTVQAFVISIQRGQISTTIAEKGKFKGFV